MSEAATTAVAPAANNLVTIAAFIAFMLIWPTAPAIAILVLGLGTSAGVLVQFVVQIPAVLKLGFKWRLRINLRDPGLISTLKTGLPMIVYVVGALVSFSFRNAFSLSTGEDGPSTLLYAWTWFQLPHGIIAVSLARTLFTEMSGAAAREDMPGFKRHLQTGISGTLLLIIPLAALMFVLAAPLMQVFRAGAFQSEDVTYVASVLSFWVLTLPTYSLQMYLFNVFAALRRFWIYSLVCTAFCVLQCALYALLCPQDKIALNGVPIADFVYYTLTTVLLLYILYRLIGGFGLRASLLTGIKALGAAILGAAVAAVLLVAWPLGDGKLAGLLELLLYGLPGLAVALICCRLLRVPEMALLGGVFARLRRKR